jgi:hypothetical protein
MKQETLEEVLKKIKSTKLCLMAHPDNEVHSEFADRITDLEEIEIELLKTKSQQGCSEEEVIAFCEWFAFELNHYGYPTNENILKALKQFKKK